MSEDSGASCDIDSVEVFVIPGDSRLGEWCARRAVILVLVRSDGGPDGWGEAYAVRGQEAAIEREIVRLGERLIGRSLFESRAVLASALGETPPATDLSCTAAAASGVEIALWDLEAKLGDLSVSELVGPGARESVPVYANIWSDKPKSAAQLAQKASDLAADGFELIKIYPFEPGVSIDEGVNKVAAVRAAVGASVEIAVDLVRRATRQEAIEIAARLEPLELAWLEEPFAPERVDSYIELAKATSIPLMTGETLTGQAPFRSLADSHAVSFINPDVCLVGGISVFLDIADSLADSAVLLSPHNFNSMTVGLAATVHAAASHPDTMPCEYFPELVELIELLNVEHLLAVDGAVAVPAGVGLGLELDRDHVVRLCR